MVLTVVTRTKKLIMMVTTKITLVLITMMTVARQVSILCRRMQAYHESRLPYFRKDGCSGDGDSGGADDDDDVDGDVVLALITTPKKQ